MTTFEIDLKIDMHPLVLQGLINQLIQRIPISELSVQYHFLVEQLRKTDIKVFEGASYQSNL
jgi:hypothetical protein